MTGADELTVGSTRTEREPSRDTWP